MDSVKSKMNNLIDSMKEQLFEMGDAIYDHPEIGLQEVFASKLLEDWLENHGFLVERGLGSMPTAFRAVYEQGTGGPSIGLLTEYDALAGIGQAKPI